MWMVYGRWEAFSVMAHTPSKVINETKQKTEKGRAENQLNFCESIFAWISAFKLSSSEYVGKWPSLRAAIRSHTSMPSSSAIGRRIKTKFILSPPMNDYGTNLIFTAPSITGFVNTKGTVVLHQTPLHAATVKLLIPTGAAETSMRIDPSG